MKFSDVKKIYEKKKKKREENSFSFVIEIFKEIEEKYKEEARQRGKNPQQSWNAWSGKNLQKLLGYIVEEYISDKYDWVGITDDDSRRGFAT